MINEIFIVAVKPEIAYNSKYLRDELLYTQKRSGVKSLIYADWQLSTTEKIDIIEVIDFDIDWNGLTNIDEILECIHHLKSMGASHINIDRHEEYGAYLLDIFATSRRLESDEELAIRTDIMQARALKSERNQREIYEQLKNKLG